LTDTTTDHINHAAETEARLPRRISPRDLTDYRLCPRRVWFRRVAKVALPERPSPTLMLGNAVHSALYLFFGLRPEDRQPVQERLHQCLRAVWRKHRQADTFATREEERDYGLQGLALLTDFAPKLRYERRPTRSRAVGVRSPEKRR